MSDNHRIFNICTIANDLDQYAKMKESFIQAGFTNDKCRFTLYDNSHGNQFDPYSTITSMLGETEEPYLIFCHQDILVNQGDGVEKLVGLLAELDKLDPKWAIVGNAGCKDSCSIAAHFIDLTINVDCANLPKRVYTLDENFIVIKIGAKLACAQTLSGFHLYATDITLDALKKGYSAYVISFKIMHLSSGNRFSEAFYDCRKNIMNHWSPFFRYCMVSTPCGANLYFSKYSFVRNAIEKNNFIGQMLKNRRIYTLIVRTKRLFSRA
jgi:hypothetical protein